MTIILLAGCETGIDNVIEQEIIVDEELDTIELDPIVEKIEPEIEEEPEIVDEDGQEDTIEPDNFLVRFWRNESDIYSETRLETRVVAGSSIAFPKVTRDGFVLESWYIYEEGQKKLIETLDDVGKDLDVYPYWISISDLINLTNDDELLDSDICRIGVPPEKNLYKGINPDDLFDYEVLSAGFPISEYRIPSSGVVKAKVIMIDFEDYPGMMNQSEINDYLKKSYIEPTNEHFAFQSQGNFIIEWDIVPGYIRMNSSFSDLNLSGSRDNTGRVKEDYDTLVIETMEIADDQVDFTDISMVLIFLDPELSLINERLTIASFSLPGNDPLVTNEGNIYNFQLVPNDPFADSDKANYGFIHSIGHHLGMTDLYNSNWDNDYLEQLDFVGVFDLMNWASTRDFGNNLELFGWSKYLLGWIEDSQVRCVSNSITSTTTHYLVPNHVSSEQDKLIVIPLTQYRALVVEVKAPNQFCEECSGGVYTYLINSEEGSGAGQIQLLRPEGSDDRFFRDAYLSEGESISYGNIMITNTSTIEYPVIQVDIS